MIYMDIIAFKVGWKVTCPKCDHHIATCVSDCYAGEVLLASKFQFTAGEMEAQRPMTCIKCGSRYFSMNRMHSEHGWQPNLHTE